MLRILYVLDAHFRMHEVQYAGDSLEKSISKACPIKNFCIFLKGQERQQDPIQHYKRRRSAYIHTIIDVSLTDALDC